MTMRPAGIVADKKERFPKRKKLAGQPAAESSFVNVFVELFSETADDGEATKRSAIERIRALSDEGRASHAGADQAIAGSSVLVRRNIVSATVPIASLGKLEADPDIAFVHPSEPLRFDQPVVTSQLTAAPPQRRIGDADLRKAHGDGNGVIIGIIDVGGFDFAHPDFLDAKGKHALPLDLGSGRRLAPAARPVRLRLGDNRAPDGCRLKVQEGGRIRPPCSNGSRSGRRLARHPCGKHRRRQQRRLPEGA